jgi:hypothetical protein
MKKSMKYQLSKMFGSNVELNKKALNMKNSFDEINRMIGKSGQKKSGKSK